MSSNQPGLKTVATDPTHLDNKRERRRGAAGRAAALRRAPSDSDCSGETASLSADSGERAVRPPPVPQRQGKTRSSRRRGSEWEVLEGLKDGQRFDKRPEVFNGYLHKKRKWPLKGWHKRFFVVDGGILVYARSPTDVARGRLHGSVDVGLSVISAKARRRRIDIDADEFIYHLRAKTPDVFRTWLNVLKAHRLYRQHLLTFGARESVPKIHAPLEDLPATDTSSRGSSVDVFPSYSEEQLDLLKDLRPLSSTSPEVASSLAITRKADTPRSVMHWLSHSVENNTTINIDKGHREAQHLDVCNKKRSLCSMNCMKKMRIRVQEKFKSPVLSTTPYSVDGISSTDEHSLATRDPSAVSKYLCDMVLNSPVRYTQHMPALASNDTNQRNMTKTLDSSSLFRDKQRMSTPAYYFFAKRRFTYEEEDYIMKRSRKSTNLIKYKNMSEEPPLDKPLAKCLLLGNYKVQALDDSYRPSYEENIDNEVPSIVKKSTKDFDVITMSEQGRITEKLLSALFRNDEGDVADEIVSYINEVVKEVYDVRSLNKNNHPIRVLFKSLLEFWLENSSRNEIKHLKDVDVQYDTNTTRDRHVSSIVIRKESKQTQFNGVHEGKTIRVKVHKPGEGPVRVSKKTSDTPSALIKDRRVQELERILKNTVYVCDNIRKHNVEKDIKITKTLINNLDQLSRLSEFDSQIDTNVDSNVDESNSYAELPKLQETIEHLMSETAIPPNLAKEFLSAYLDVLLHGSSKSQVDSSSSTEPSKESNTDTQPICEVLTDTIQKKVSKGMTTLRPISEKNESSHKIQELKQPIDAAQQHIKNVLEKVTTIFSKAKKNDSKDDAKDVNEIPSNFPGKDLIREDQNSVVIDLYKYNLEHIQMLNDPTAAGLLSITIKLREKPQKLQESKRTSLCLNFATKPPKPVVSEIGWTRHLSDSSIQIFSRSLIRNPNNPLYLTTTLSKDIPLKPYCSSDSRTFCKVIHESEHSLDLSFKSSNFFRNEFSDAPRSLQRFDDSQPCYVMSNVKLNNLASKLMQKKCVKTKPCRNCAPLEPMKCSAPMPSPVRTYELSSSDGPSRIVDTNMIDESFVLLLLENLTLLSKSVPSLHKEINNLYTKLKRKHQKLYHKDGLSLLGKIYKTAYRNDTRSIGSQYVEPDDRAYLETATNTSLISTESKNHASPVPNVLNHEIQTEKTEVQSNHCMVSKPLSTFTDMTQSEPRETHKKLKIDESALDVLIKCVFDRADSQNFRIVPSKAQRKYNVNIDQDSSLRKSKRDRTSRDMRQSLMREISLLAPSCKISTQCQTEKCASKRHKNPRDFDVYPLLWGNKKTSPKSSSLLHMSKDMSDELKTLYRCPSDSACCGLVSPTTAPLRGPQAGFVSGTPGGRLAGWIIESGGPLESASRELGQAQLSVQQLQRLLEALELQHQVHHDTDVSLEGASPNVKKDRRKFGLRKKKSNSKCASVELQPPHHIDPSSSHMALSALTAPPSPGGGASSAPNSAASLPIDTIDCLPYLTCNKTLYNVLWKC